MYGIMTEDGTLVLCIPTYQSSLVLSPMNYKNRPLMIGSAYEADKLLQEAMVHFNNYTLKVFKYTREEEEYQVIRRLRGY